MKKLLMLLALLTACADETDPCVDNNTCSDNKSEEQEPTNFLIMGSVISAFTIKVDGDKYSDIEDFYTQELARLPEKITKAGYPNYQVRLEGDLGYSDLIDEMTIYLAPRKNRGFASISEVYNDGSFEFELPKEAAGDVYQIKAVKRIAVILDNETETKRLCYNFAAIETAVKYKEVDKPVVLDNFETSITAYDCANDNDEGLSIPE